MRPRCWAVKGDHKNGKTNDKNPTCGCFGRRNGRRQKSCHNRLDAVVALITKEVGGGGAVTLPGVGKIYCRERPERMVRNPATGEQIKKEADKVVKMTIAKALKDSVNG